MIVTTDTTTFNVTDETPLDFLIEKALPDLREIVWHSDGRITAKTGGDRAVRPKKLYNGKDGVRTALAKLINDKHTPEREI